MSEAAKPKTTASQVDLVAGMKVLQAALGSDDLAKQVFADANALDRQTSRNHFEARLEYVKQIAQISANTQTAVEEQGRQTLKWLFLLNAGAIALVLTFAGSKAPELKAMLVAALIKPIAMYAVGCVFVICAGAAGFFNFLQGLGSLPSASALHQFTDPANTAWPNARQISAGETPQDFAQRHLPKIDRTFQVGVICAVFSAVAFVAGSICSALVIVRG
jgi:hypothetical protein